MAQKEEEELKILENYLPEMMSCKEIEKIAQAKKEEMGVDDKAKMGMLMGAIMKELKGKANGEDVKTVVEGLKKKKPEFKKRYGKDAPDVMYAVAAKTAKKKGDTSKSDDKIGRAHV